METFLWHPARHRRKAFLLEQMKDDPAAQELALYHRHCAKMIQDKLNAGTARICAPDEARARLSGVR